ncbi:MAG: patatin-like phospholipase family protein [Lysobacter sp.]|nr:patatin-like phospholipase family protein [Lysobacter sp.]
MENAALTLPEFQAQLLAEGLRELFGEMNDDMLAALMPLLEWVEVAGGEVVVRQGDTDRDLYVVICGRLRAYGGGGPPRRHPRPDAGEGPHRRVLSEITRGETIGEMSFFTGAPRVATVVALRDSVLARITRPNLEKLLTAWPQVTLSMARLVIDRLGRANAPRRAKRRPTNLCLLPITPGVDVAALGERLVARLPADGEPILLTAAAIEARVGVKGIANAGKADGDRYRQLTKALDELESRHASVVYAPDGDLASEWSQRCLRMADRILLLADAGASPEAGAAEARLLGGEKKVTAAEQVLVLLHGEDAAMPGRTAEWLDRRPAGAVAGHLHIRPARDADVARLARTQSAGAIGLVLCGGGARCFAHLGVYKALQEHGVQVDYVGGSGMGAVMGALIALDAPADELIAYAREAFTASPTGDISLMPLTALIKGRQLKSVLEEAIEHLGGADARIEDTWKSFYCVSANYSRAFEAVLRRGSLAKGIRASCAVPGLLPPVPIGGDLMVDGGVFNNYPTDVMARAGVAKIIGVNISRDAFQDVAYDEVPGSWTLAWDKVTGSRRKYRVPSLMSTLMNATTLYSASREQYSGSLTDLEFRLNLPSVGILDWHAFDHAVSVGYRNASKALAAMAPEELAAYGAR